MLLIACNVCACQSFLPILRAWPTECNLRVLRLQHTSCRKMCVLFDLAWHRKEMPIRMIEWDFRSDLKGILSPDSLAHRARIALETTFQGVRLAVTKAGRFRAILICVSLLYKSNAHSMWKMNGTAFSLEKYGRSESNKKKVKLVKCPVKWALRKCFVPLKWVWIVRVPCVLARAHYFLSRKKPFV